MLIVFTGQNEYVLTRELKKRVDDFVQLHGDFALERLDAEDTSYEQLYDAVTTLPFLASEKLVVLRSPGSNKQFAESIEKLIELVPETTTVCIVESKIDKRSSYYKFLKKQPEFYEFIAPYSRDLVVFVQQEAVAHGGSISARDAQYLIERIGPNQLLIANEVAKLGIYNPLITKESIDALVDANPQSKIFDLIDAVFANNPKRALQLYDEQRKQKIEPQAIIGMLVWQLHGLAVVKSAGASKSAADIAAASKLSSFVVQKTQSIARGIDMQALRKQLRDLAKLEYASKTRAYDLDQALQNYIITMY